MNLHLCRSLNSQFIFIRMLLVLRQTFKRCLLPLKVISSAYGSAQTLLNLESVSHKPDVITHHRHVQQARGSYLKIQISKYCCKWYSWGNKYVNAYCQLTIIDCWLARGVDSFTYTYLWHRFWFMVKLPISFVDSWQDKMDVLAHMIRIDHALKCIASLCGKTHSVVSRSSSDKQKRNVSSA